MRKRLASPAQRILEAPIPRPTASERHLSGGLGGTSFRNQPDCERIGVERVSAVKGGSTLSTPTSLDVEGSDQGRVGPAPSPDDSMAPEASSMSRSSSVSVAAAIQPSICSGSLAPTMAPVTPGNANVHAMATEPTEAFWRSAIGRSPSAKARPALSLSPEKLGLDLRQSPASRDAERSSLQRPLSSPDAMGL